MHIIFSALVRSMQRFVSIQSFNMDSTGYISGIEMFPHRFEPDRTSLDPDKAYICDFRDLRYIEPTLPLPPLICVLEPGVEADKVFFNRRTVAVVSGQSIRDVMLLLQRLLYEFGCTSSRLTEVSHELLQCGDTKELIAAGFRTLGNPLILTDSDQKILAFTDLRAVDHPAYHELVSLERLPAGLPGKDSYQPWSDPVFHLPREDSLGLPPGLCINLTVRSKIVGHLHLLSFNHPFGEHDLRILELLGNLLAVELWKHPLQHPFEPDTEKEHLLREILDNTAGDEAAILAAQQTLGFALAPYLYVVLALSRDDPMSPRKSFFTLAKEMAAMLPSTFGFTYRNSSLLLVSSEEEITDFNAFLAPLKPLFDRFRLVGGVSNTFSSLHLLCRGAYQSRKALQLGQPLHRDSQFYFYKDYSVYHMIDLCLRSEPLEAFCSPELLRLSTHSQENENDLLKTLRIYLQCGRNKALTAKTMFVHVSTVKYRMAQIQKIIGLDLDNDDNALKLMISFKMLEYQEVFQNYERDNVF